jgi:long-subunit fatty acid transport protein
VGADGAEISGGDVVVNLPRNWKDSVGFRVGPGFQVTDGLEIFGSLGVTTPAVPKETIDASTIDSLRLNGAIGGRYEFSRVFALAASYNLIYFMPVDTGGASILAKQKASSVSFTPSADGKYNAMLNFLNVNATVSF